MPSDPAYSWGRAVRGPQPFAQVPDQHVDLAALLCDIRMRHGAATTILPYGNGRSYGDSNLNPGGVLLDTRPMNRHLAFDASSGVLTCEAGMLLSDVLERHLPQGWFPAVTPGTQFVTVGGAIANDVHGKNHHQVGSFGDHVLWLELQRSDGRRLVCSPDQNPEWFAATIGGIGLTGLITRAAIRLRRVRSHYVESETIRFRRLEEFFELSAASESSHDYCVAWIDCAFGDSRLGRGLFSRGNHAEGGPPTSTASRPHRVPFAPPVSLVNSWSVKAFNTVYYHRQRGDRTHRVEHYRSFFYPLDAVADWNRIYGPRGFYQYQCVLPPHKASAIRALLECIAASGMGSFLAVLKTFGNLRPRGMLSFPMPGTTLALDFPNRGAQLHKLFDALDRIVADAGGRLYPAKDGRMGPRLFNAGYPRLREFEEYVDPAFSSGLWRRVTGRD